MHALPSTVPELKAIAERHPKTYLGGEAWMHDRIHDKIVVKFRSDNAAEAEYTNAAVYRILDIAVPQYQKIYDTGKSIYPACEKYNPGILVNHFIPGVTASDKSLCHDFYPIMTDKLIVKACVGQLLDAHTLNFVVSPENYQTHLIDCEFGLIDPNTNKLLNESVIDLFKIMSGEINQFRTRALSCISWHFHAFRNGFQENYAALAQQCDDVQSRIDAADYSAFSADYPDLPNILTQRTSTLKRYLLQKAKC